jgi:hypothetical protein
MKALLLVTLLVVISSVVLAAQGPSNAYCGSYLFGEVTGKAVFTAGAQKFDLNIKAFDKELSCSAIEYKVDSTNGQLVIPDAKTPSSCIGKMLIQNKLKADFKYTESDNTIDLNLGVANVKLSQC